MTDMTPYLPGFLAAYSILFVAALSPGPSVAMLIGVATREGRAPALMATCGIACGSITLNILTMLGVGLLLAQSAFAMSLLRVLGAMYLLWLAYGAFRKAINPPEFHLIPVAPQTGLRHFLTGYLLQVTNPKAVAFWVAIASIGATSGGGALIVFAFVLGAFIISFACHGIWAVALSSAPIRTAYAASRSWVEAALGGFLAFAAFKLATGDINSPTR